MFESHSFFIAREWFTEQGLGSKTWACNLCGFGLGFWVEKETRAMGHAAGSEFKAQMDLGTTVPYT